jgi:D-arabinono-1,4-lactone oxidase
VDTATGIITAEAGIRLYQVSEALEKHGLAIPNLGSIEEQSLAGVVSTGTHGSSLWHGLISERIVALTIVLADGTARECSPESDPDLFRAALLSLGALGVVARISFQAVPAFTLHWDQTVVPWSAVLDLWEDNNRLWSQADFVRVWWLPYTRRAVLWKADAVKDMALREPPASWYDSGGLGFHVYHNLLLLSRYVPRILPWVEWFVFGMQYGFRAGPPSTISAVQPSRKALLMNCLYSQFVNEWALPLSKGPEALRRLGAWLNRLQPGDDAYVSHGIPFSADGLHVHAPVEVRVTGSTRSTSADKANRPWLDPTCKDEPTLYLNAIMYRPYGLDPPGWERYYAGFEWLMRDLGGRPHWAKNFTASSEDIDKWYGEDLRKWKDVRDRADPEGMFLGAWHRRTLFTGDKILPLEEEEQGRSQAPEGGIHWEGRLGIETPVA